MNFNSFYNSNPSSFSEHYNPVRDPAIQNLRFTNNKRAILTYRDDKGCAASAVYPAASVVSFVDISDQVYQCVDQGLSISVEELEGYHQFATRFNSIPSNYRFPIKKPDGTWDLPQMFFVTSRVVDTSYLTASNPDQALEALGVTQNGITQVRQIRNLISRDRRLLESQANMMNNFGRMFNAFNRGQRPRPPKKSKYRQSDRAAANFAAANHRHHFKNKQMRNFNWSDDLFSEYTPSGIQEATAGVASININDQSVSGTPNVQTPNVTGAPGAEQPPQDIDMANRT
ncbi:hypothetical protein DFP72DRAFT_844572 [Ephemerocybe angulata]|uniref:Uncharacterized protein n=1 Tax=Ephemerocybe angulata TaxID=980116 RepID=A0A8H6I5T1_9AGAR|nr:hypothetical protein DFP72DRAFT_844572 [Tulosesus angulatus]